MKKHESLRSAEGSVMDVCYAIDSDAVQSRLIVTSLFSLIKSAYDPSSIRLHILADHGGRSSLAEGVADRIDDLVVKGGAGSVDFVDCGDWIDSNFGTLRSATGCIIANWFRFSIPWTVNSERCLYLDNDTVVLGDLGELFAEDMRGAWLGVAENAFVEVNFNIENWFSKEGIICNPGRHRHFPQAGVMLIDSSRARISGFVKRMPKCRLFALPGSDGVVRNEPVLYECLYPEEIHWLPKKYHREANTWLTAEERKSGWQPFDSISDAVIVHMNGGRHASGKCAEYVDRIWRDYERFVNGASVSGTASGGGAVDWGKYVDAVYLIHFTGDSHKERLPDILSELDRIGISRNAVRIKYTANSRWHDAAADKCVSEHPGWSMPGWWADVGMATFDILVEALATGLESIAVFETDCVFIKDTGLLKRYLDTIPENAGIAKLEWFDVGGGVEQVAPSAEGESAEYWEPRRSRTSGAACYIIRRKGMEELLRVLRDFCPGPSDFAMNFCRTDIYVSRGHAAIQRAYPSSKTGGCNAYGKMDLSKYNLPEGYEHSTGICHVSEKQDSCEFSLPAFPVNSDNIKDVVKTLSDLSREHRDYREPSCLMARVIHEMSYGSNTGVVRMLLEQGLRIKEKKPGLPVDDWCWNGGPEKLLSELNSPPGSPGSEQYIVI